MKPWCRLLSAGSLGTLAVALAGCGVVPVPRVLQPVLGSPASYTDTQLCVVDLTARRGLRVIRAQKENGSGKLFVQDNGKRRRLPESKRGGYAVDEPWFRGEQPIRQYGRRFVKYGPPRVVPESALTRGADHHGIPVFLDRTDIRQPSALYVPVEPGCVFQPYVDAQYVTRR